MTVGEFYRRRRVLVTGLTGFKGLWLASWLERLGASVAGLALPPTTEMLRGWPGLLERFPCVIGDIREQAVVEQALARTRPELIFHLSAQPLVRLSYERPVETLAVNVLGVAHVLEAARTSGTVRGVVVVTSDKCYENREQDAGYREGDPLGGHDPYSASKGCAEIVTAAYRRSFGRDDWRVASVRAGNVIGGGDWAVDRLVPDFVRSLIAGQPCLVRRPSAVRPWQHVLEPLSGYLLLGERLVQGESGFDSGWNFGPPAGDAVSVRALARLLAINWPDARITEAAHETGPHEARLLRLDSTKAAARLDWRPLLSAPERVAWTAAWYRAWHDNPHAVWAMVERQLAQYEERMRQCPKLSARWWPASTASSALPSHAA
ncbi:MAG: CDP-glucose 4,6-dehydratase [Gemmataceae bacterium]|nr:CDP-glucose 4,6-dehydratase [Gemmataceae bacterium]